MTGVAIFAKHDGQANGDVPAGYRIAWWRPTLTSPAAPGPLQLKLLPYSLFPLLGLFSSSGFGAVQLIDRQGRVDHISYVFPKFARFPFMAPGDLQIGATWTRPIARGRGLALAAIAAIVGKYGAGRTLWYVSDTANTASIAVIQKAGFARMGQGEKMPRFGTRLLGYYAFTKNKG